MLNSFVYIVILNWNGWRDTIECLESVFRQDYPHFFVTVLDNDSSDQSFEHISQWLRGLKSNEIHTIPELAHLTAPPVNKPIAHRLCHHIDQLKISDIDECQLALIKTGGNLGFAGGNNVALKWIAANKKEGSYVWLLNNDTIIEPDCLSQMLKHLQLKEQSGRYTCGSLVKFYQQPNVVQALGGAKFNFYTAIGSQTLGRFLSDQSVIDHEKTAEEMDYITGCSWLLPARFLDEVGLMEDQYFLYYEEIDWVMRSRDQYQLTYAPKSIVYHKEGSSIGSKTINRAPSVLSEFYMARNKIKFMRKFFPLRMPLILGVVFLQAINRFRQGHHKNGLILFKVLLGKTKLN